MLSFLLLTNALALSVSASSECDADPARKGLLVDRLAAIQNVMDEMVAAGHVGMVTQVSRYGQTLTYTAGEADKEQHKSISEKSIFRVCSLTKPITTVALWTLIQQGKGSLSDPLERYLSEFAPDKLKVLELCSCANFTANATNCDCPLTGYRLVPAVRSITLDHLVTHTSGIYYGLFGRYGGRYGRMTTIYSDLCKLHKIPIGCHDVKKPLGSHVKTLAQLPLVSQPGTAWYYGMNTDLLGRVIELLSGVSLGEYLRTAIFEPLGMRDTFFFLEDKDKEKEARIATLYYKEAPGQPMLSALSPEAPAMYKESQRYYQTKGDRRYESGGCGLFSTPEDYTKFAQMIATGGGSVLSRKVLEQMSKDRSPPVLPNYPLPRPPLPADYVNLLGVDVKDLGALSVTSGFSRLGLATLGVGADIPLSEGALYWVGWHGTSLWIDPKEGFSFVFMRQCHGWSLGCCRSEHSYVKRMLTIAASSIE